MEGLFLSLAVLAYYSRRSVQEEVFDFLKGRWAGLEGVGKKWVRWEGDRPLALSRPSDVYALFSKYVKLNPRSVYGSIEVFKRLESRRDVEDDYELNVERATPFIDVDLEGEDFGVAWRRGVEVVKTIVGFLEDRGVKDSVYVLWSGNGFHVRVNENAIEDSLRKASPVEAAWALVEYTLVSLEEKLLEVIKGCGGCVKVENIVNPKRVFTAPLSLHREKNRVAVAFKPGAIDGFDPEWSNPSNPRHDPQAWRSFRRGEADPLVEEALKALGKRGRGEHTRISVEKPVERRAEVVPPAPEEPVNVPKLGRFQVMGLLQAARYYVLRGDLEKAKSWGLNRAIFYAWAKYYGPSSRRLMSKVREAFSASARSTYRDEELRWDSLGGEKAQVSPRGYYTMGGVEQTPEDYDRNIAYKIEMAGIPYEKAWEAAVEYVRGFPERVLLDPQEFYRKVYEPVRDRFAELVLSEKKSGGK
ncbi:hypothetical protein TCELL_0168 [Thermogladius calderae 1633]|uniref:Uncharacterized protein n=1 Tax=Thermogladius calderae (strain DSM 22663 / VKM B-2946 / 1633) TaxID=1184251 RepID=I3TCV5_THEC1|nr:hypothetical protein [Thermogladius calderae]AFK50593.1 hypothetical protein TCELL_0168 [Thermogladius calderae 1633]